MPADFCVCVFLRCGISSAVSSRCRLTNCTLRVGRCMSTTVLTKYRYTRTENRCVWRWRDRMVNLALELCVFYISQRHNQSIWHFTNEFRRKLRTYLHNMKLDISRSPWQGMRSRESCRWLRLRETYICRLWFRSQQSVRGLLIWPYVISLHFADRSNHLFLLYFFRSQSRSVSGGSGSWLQQRAKLLRRLARAIYTYDSTSGSE